MESEGLLLRSEGLTTDPYPEPDEKSEWNKESQHNKGENERNTKKKWEYLAIKQNVLRITNRSTTKYKGKTKRRTRQRLWHTFSLT